MQDHLLSRPGRAVQDTCDGIHFRVRFTCPIFHLSWHSQRPMNPPELPRRHVNTGHGEPNTPPTSRPPRNFDGSMKSSQTAGEGRGMVPRSTAVVFTCVHSQKLPCRLSIYSRYVCRESKTSRWPYYCQRVIFQE
ncbi:hypothetical protein BaRGS_00036687 [Batillaria attramentaria]|uniref:Uncharacterized protein n=1 Tax=Batillaria attramentaria TaxID=370345 RepID=A0ABD0JB77_9CAEN